MLDQIKQLFADSTDLFTDTLDNGYWPMEIAYFPVMCDERIKDGVLIPYSRMSSEECSTPIRSMLRRTNPTTGPTSCLRSDHGTR